MECYFILLEELLKVSHLMWKPRAQGLHVVTVVRGNLSTWKNWIAVCYGFHESNGRNRKWISLWKLVTAACNFQFGSFLSLQVKLSLVKQMLWVWGWSGSWTQERDASKGFKLWWCTVTASLQSFTIGDGFFACWSYLSEDAISYRISCSNSSSHIQVCPESSSSAVPSTWCHEQFSCKPS